MAKSEAEQAEERGGIVAFRAAPELISGIDVVAAAEGISRSDVARRAVIRDLRAAGKTHTPTVISTRITSVSLRQCCSCGVRGDSIDPTRTSGIT